MRGREEHELFIEQQIDRLMFNRPQMICNYRYHFGENTSATKKTYISNVLNFVDYYKDRDITELNNTDIRKYLDEVKYNKNHTLQSVSTRATRLYAITHFFNYLIDDGIINKNPCANIKAPHSTEENEIISLDKTEMIKIKENISGGCGSRLENAKREEWKERDLAIFMLGCSTGLRVTAISEIDINDIDFNNNTIKVIEKGNKIRTIFIGNEIKSALIDWINKRNELLNGAECNALFISNRRNRITVRSIQMIIQKYTQNVGKHITPHKMRSTCATMLYDQTGDIYRVKAQLGHSRLDTSKRYAKMSKTKEYESAAMLDAIWS